MVGATGLEPVQPKSSDFKSLAYTNFATPPQADYSTPALTAGRLYSGFVPRLLVGVKDFVILNGALQGNKDSLALR